ncbi:MAG: carbohydrate kinase, partial [Spirochaetales bacterium]|nr:carbohydrate kinase [Spirochaetales bacterium]
GLETLEKRGHFYSDKITVSGGGSKSDLICQISADIFGRPLVRGRTYETSGLGAAILTAGALGLFPSIDAAVNRMVHYERTFTPRPENVQIYNRLYKVYRKIYLRMKDLYQDIQKITGYPEL